MPRIGVGLVPLSRVPRPAGRAVRIASPTSCTAPAATAAPTGSPRTAGASRGSGASGAPRGSGLAGTSSLTLGAARSSRAGSAGSAGSAGLPGGSGIAGALRALRSACRPGGLLRLGARRPPADRRRIDAHLPQDPALVVRKFHRRRAGRQDEDQGEEPFHVPPLSPSIFSAIRLSAAQLDMMSSCEGSLCRMTEICQRSEPE